MTIFTRIITIEYFQHTLFDYDLNREQQFRPTRRLVNVNPIGVYNFLSKFLKSFEFGTLFTY